MKLVKIVVILIILLTLLTTGIPIVTTGQTPAPLPLGPPPPNGDWWVDDNTVINDTSLMVKGNLTINNTGTLELINVTLLMDGNITVKGEFILRNVTLEMNCTGQGPGNGIGNSSNGSIGIYVEPGGLMYILDYDNDPNTNDHSIITSSIEDGSHCYFFWVKAGSEFRIENSMIHQCGYGDIFVPNHHNGLFIETDHVQIKNSTISQTMNGVIFNSSSSSNNYVYNCTFKRGTNLTNRLYGMYGLRFVNSPNNVVSNCRFINIYGSLTLDLSNKNEVTGCHFEDFVGVLSSSRLTCAIYIYRSNNNTLLDNTAKMVYYGITFFKSKDCYIKNYSIDNTRYGIEIIYNCEYITMENINIFNLFFPEFNEDAMGILIYLSNSHIYIINCTISAKRNTFGIMWEGSQTGARDFLLRNCTIDCTAVALSADNFGLMPVGTISDVVVEDSYFRSEGHGFAALYQINNWTFTNCTFERTTNWRYSNFRKSAATIANDADNIVFTDCDFRYTDDEIDVSGFHVMSDFADVTFDIRFNNCDFYNNSFEGISIWQEAFSKPSPPINDLRGSLIIENCSFRDNGRNGIQFRGDGFFVDIINSEISNSGEHGIMGIMNDFNGRSEINLRNCNFTNNGKNGLYIYDTGSDCDYNIYNCTITENQEKGISTIYSECNINIQESDLIQNNEEAVEAKECYVIINKSNIIDNYAAGILLENSYSNITGCEVAYNDGIGLDLDSCEGIISDNIVKNNQFSGISVRNSPTEFFIQNNQIQDNGHMQAVAGIDIYDSTATIRNNTFTAGAFGSYASGLKINKSSWVNIEENTFDGDFSDTLIEIEKSDGRIENNELLDGKLSATGIFCHDDSSVQIRGNTIDAPGKFGIYLSPDNDGPITKNTLSRWNMGIFITSPNVPIEDNLLSSNYNGIVIDNTMVNLKNNTFQDSYENGVWVKENGEVELLTNTYTGNNIGVFVDGGKLTSVANMLEDNERGLSLKDTNEVTLTGDMINENGIGIQATDSSFYITSCTFEANDDMLSMVNSVCNIDNSSITDSIKSFILDEGSQCRIINTNLTGGTVDILDPISTLEQQWFLNLSIVDPELNPLSDIRVVIKDQGDLEVFNQTTAAHGQISWLNITSMAWSESGTRDPNPYKIILAKTGFGTTANELEFTGNTNLTLTAFKLSECISQVVALDTPNDQGGSVTLSWNMIPILNFGNFNIYVDTEYITSVGHLTPINSSITDQGINSIIITDLDDEPLENGKEYYFAVTITDSNGYENWLEVRSSNSVIAVDNLAPEPISNLTAVDTPNDNGGSITLTWERSSAPDFQYYAVFVLTGSVDEDLKPWDFTPNMQLTDVTQTGKLIDGLKDNISYYFVILVYDLNGNVNFTFEIIGPVIPFDNLSPVINTTLSTPSIHDRLEFNQTEKKMFRVILTTEEDATYHWYLDGEQLENVTDPYYLLSMLELDIGPHNLTVVVIEEPSGLSDSQTWNFTVLEVDEPVTPASSEPASNYLLMPLIILILVLFILFLFGTRHTYRYLGARKTVRTIPALGDRQALELINEKREQGDRYVLNKLVTGLPEVLQSRPNKLFLLLNMLSKDDAAEVRENAAKNIAALLDKNPQYIFNWLKSLQATSVKPEVYLMIAKAVKNELTKDIVTAYHSNLTAKKEEEYQASLENAAGVLKRAEGLKFGMELSIIYSTLNDFYKYRTVSKISTSKPVIEKIQGLKQWAPEILHPEIIEVFNKLHTVTESLGKYEKVDTIEDKLTYLSLALNILEDAFRLSREKLVSPEKDIFFQILNSWRNIISLSIRELRGRADLSLNLIGKEMIVEQDTMTLMLEIQNNGRSTAERVLVELVPTDDYVVLTGPKELGTIGQRKNKEVTFTIRPRTKEAFRAEFAVHFDDTERKEKSISFGDLVTAIELGKEYREIPNPYIVGTPIKTGSKLFVGRRDLIGFIQKNIRGSLQENIIVLIGHRRTGKTTLLKQLPIYLDKSYIPVYIDIQGVLDPGMDAFFYLLSTEIVAAMRGRGIEINTPAFEAFKDRPSYFFEYEFLKEVNEKLGDSIVVLMFDEFEELEVKVDSGLLDKNIFSYFRHLMQHTTHLAFIFTGSSRLENLKTDYWSIMFNIALYKRIGFLSREDTEKLITEPVKEYNMIYDALALEKIYRLTYGHPYFTQLLCHALVNLHNQKKKNYITIQDVQSELTRIIERGQMHFDFIWDQSPVMERLVMTTMTRVFNEEETVTVSSIVNKLVEYDITLSSNDVTRTLDNLASKDIVTKIMDHTITYEFKVELIRIWLESTKHLDQVAEQHRAAQ